jgi:hypothetical protein
LILFSFVGSTQEKPGTIEGTCQELSTGLPLKDAKVSLKDANGKTIQAVSDSVGFYSFAKVLPGIYSIEANYPVYTKQTFTKLNVTAGQKIIQNINFSSPGIPAPIDNLISNGCCFKGLPNSLE